MKIKYMGTSDVRSLPAGTDWGGILANPIEADLVWNWDNNHVLDIGELGLSDEAIALLLEDPEFVDVSDMEVVPLGAAEKMFKGRQDPNANMYNPREPEVVQGDLPDEAPAEEAPKGTVDNPADDAATGEPAPAASLADAGGATTTVGGSGTDTPAGGSTRGRGSRSTS